MIRIRKKAFTLVEVLIAAGVTAVFLTMAITLFTRYNQYYSIRQSSAGLMQDCAIFVSRLRNDLNNAVKTSDEYLTIDEKQVKFDIYDSGDGKVKPVIYSMVQQPDGYYSMARRIGNGSNHIIIDKKIASLSWHLKEETIPTDASPFKRVGLELQINMGSKELKGKSYAFKVVLYPVRINKMR